MIPQNFTWFNFDLVLVQTFDVFCLVKKMNFTLYIKIVPQLFFKQNLAVLAILKFISQFLLALVNPLFQIFFIYIYAHYFLF